MMKRQQKVVEPIHYWMVELSLTSGEVHNFYVKAPTKIEALKKAEEWSFLADTPELRSNKLVLRY